METSIAQQANSVDTWNKLWSEEGDESWRVTALAPVYARIVELLQTEAYDGRSHNLIDVGGGRGLFADALKAVKPYGRTTIVDHSRVALLAAEAKGHRIIAADLLAGFELPQGTAFVATEVAEHLTPFARACIFSSMNGKPAFISVPNNRLGPDEEPQHTIKYTAVSLRSELLRHWNHVRVEVLGAYLLAVCGEETNKGYRLSVCLPVRDEEKDLEATLASFRGVADEIVVGIDPRTTDGTEEIARAYADVVFFMENPQADLGPNGVHFGDVRNQVASRCTGDWIFMTEGHERLVGGEETLMRLKGVVPEQARVGFVFRTGAGQRWMFPWLYRRGFGMSWKRAVHNLLDYPEGTYLVQLPQISTLHERHADRTQARAKQRQGQNRRELMDDWATEKNVNSLFYLGQEWRELDPKRAIERLAQFVEVSNNGVQKYQARLILAKEHMRAGNDSLAESCLLLCAGDDWNRTEHWVWLGDLAFRQQNFERAERFYAYAATTIGRAPNTVWWIDLCYYTYLPAQRLAMVYGELYDAPNALAWAERARDLLPSDSPAEAFEEAENNIQILKEAAGKCT